MGDGESEVYTGVSSTSNSVESPNHSYPAGNYKITIRPNGDLFAWALAFGHSELTESAHDTYANRYLLVGIDIDITPNMTRTFEQLEGHTAPDFEWSRAFYNCRFLTDMHSTSFIGWEGIIKVGDSFAMAMFSSCERLQMGGEFQLPQSLTSVRDFYCSYMFTDCSSITMNDIFQLPQRIRSTGHSFCASMFRNCSELIVNNLYSFPNFAAIPELGFQYVFSGLTATQIRTATSIINGNSEPNINHYSFNEVFPDYETLPTTWKE